MSKDKNRIVISNDSNSIDLSNINDTEKYLSIGDSALFPNFTNSGIASLLKTDSPSFSVNSPLTISSPNLKEEIQERWETFDTEDFNSLRNTIKQKTQKKCFVLKMDRDWMMMNFKKALTMAALGMRQNRSPLQL